MKIRTQLIISMVFFGVALAIISVSVITTNQQVDRLHEQEKFARNIQLEVGELGYLSNDYLLYGESQQIDRWESKYSSFSDDASNLTVNRPDQQVLINNIRANGRKLKEIFDDVVSRIDNDSTLRQNTADQGFIQISWSRMGVQTQGIVFDASRLSEMLREQADQMEQRSKLLLFALIGAFVAFLLTNYLLIYRRALKSVSNLQDGTRIIGSGNLDYSIVEKKSDEIGELARAFNQMTANLKTVTASKADLEREIAERKQAEGALRENEERLRLALDAGRLATWDWHIASGRVVWNDEHYRVLGYDPGTVEPSYDAWAVRVHPEDLAAVEAQLQQSMERGCDYTAEYRALWSDGTVHWVEARGRYDCDAVGKAIRSYGVLVDITERKRAEEALRESEARNKVTIAVEAERRRLFDVLETLPAMICLLTQDYHVAFANRSFVEKFGESNGRHCYEYCFGHTGPCEFCESYKVLETGQLHHWEVTGPDGSVMDAYDFPFTDVDGSPMILEMDIDITERKRAEAELIKAKVAAEAATKAKAAFLANMSHEIRTPMNAVIGMTGLMLEDPLTPEQKDNLELIRINGDALLTIINDILDFSKIESDKVVLEEQPFNLRALVEESLDLVAIQASEKGLNLAYIIDKNVPDAIIGDPTRLRQILGNLLSNAIKFTDKGEVKLSVSRNHDETNEVHFSVSDTGIGIPQDHMNLLFQPFSQMEPSTTRLYGGTGLGLAISKKLVEMMGGRIWAESEQGKGSTFHFVVKTASSESEPEESKQKRNIVQPELVGKRVLIVSNNKTNRSILGKQIYPWGMIPMIATSGTEALNWIRRGDDFDIAILDVQDTNGLELEAEIRKYNKALPLVLLVSLGKRAPPDHAYLTKPIKSSQLHKVLTEILSGQSAERPAAAPAISRSAQINPLRVLLAEDNVSSQKVALQMLKKLGYRADVAANGIEALHALERRHYDVVLMDVKMPEMDGLDATRIIRQCWPDNGPKVIAITAYAIEGDREKCLEAGMDDYIAKPVKMDDLKAALEKNLIGEKAAEQ